MIRLDFTRVTDEGVTFTDALNLTEDEYAALSDEDIEAMKQARFDNWLAAVRLVGHGSDEHPEDPEPELVEY